MSELHVVFKVGGAEYALPASEVLQMESYEGATPVPSARPYVAGLMQIRGQVVPVIDVRVRLGLAPVPRTLDTRVVVGRLGQRCVALVVDSAREVLKLSPESLKPPPPLVVEQSGGFVRAVAQVGKRLVLLMDLTKVVGEELPHGE